MSEQQIEVEEFRLVGDPDAVPVYYPVGWYERYIELFEHFEASKAAQAAALRRAHDQLQLARIDYAEAKRNAPEVPAHEEARKALTEFRRFASAQGFSFPHPDKLTPSTEE